MKKFIVFCLMAIVMCVNANAQTEWIVEYVPIDELTGDGGNYINIYADEECFFGFRSDLDMVTIATFEGTFDYEDGRISVLIEYYKDGVLIEKETKYFSGVTKDMATRKGKSKIVNHLKYAGDIRIVVERDNRSNFDLTIPMNPKLK